MKILAVMMMLVALFFLYRIAYPKRPATNKDVDNLPVQKKDTDISEVVVTTRFVRPNSGQPQPTRTISDKEEVLGKKPYTFADGNENRNSVIPPEKLDEVFEDDVNPDELDIEPDEDESKSSDFEDNRDNEAEIIDFDDESAELETGAELASGMSIEEMSEAAKTIDHPTDDKAGILFRVEKTDMFEQLVSGDEGKAERIKAIIDRHFRSQQPEIENDDSDSDDIENIDISEFLGLTIKK